MTSRTTANVVAVVVFFLTLAVGAFVLGTNHRVDHPETTTTVSKPAVPPAATLRSSKEVVREKGKRPSRTITTTTKTTAPAVPEGREVTSVRGGRSFIERVLGDSGVIFVQIGILLLAAFVAAAAMQRVLMGQFGGFKFGSFEVAELTNESVEKLATATGAFQKETSVKLEGLETRLKRLSEEGNEIDSTLKAQLAQIASSVADLERRVKG